jgi:hypothetical protein
MQIERGLFGSRCKQFLYATRTPLLFAAAVLVALVGSFVFPEPPQAFAITCGFGSDIGGGVCRGFLTSASVSPFNKPSDWVDAGSVIELIGAGGDGGAGYTTEMEPDQDAGYCEACGGNTITSALVLAGLI